MSCPTPYSWRVQPNGDRTCDHCGSLHPEDFITIMTGYIEDQSAGYKWEPTSKGYKVYANRPGVVNAGEGGIKFYMWHGSEPDHWTQIEGLWPLAGAVYRRKWNERFGDEF